MLFRVYTGLPSIPRHLPRSLTQLVAFDGIDVKMEDLPPSPKGHSLTFSISIVSIVCSTYTQSAEDVHTVLFVDFSLFHFILHTNFHKLMQMLKLVREFVAIQKCKNSFLSWYDEYILDGNAMNERDSNESRRGEGKWIEDKKSEGLCHLTFQLSHNSLTYASWAARCVHLNYINTFLFTFFIT